MYTLYYAPGACSMAVHIALNEIGQQVELKSISLAKGENQSPEFLKINPRGAVPVLVEDGHIIREGAAQMIYLLDKAKSPLLPRDGFARAEALEWLMFCNATLHPAFGRQFFLMKNNADKALLAAGRASIMKLWDEVEARLAKQRYLCGENCTMADILLTVIANWSGHLPEPLSYGPNCKRLFKEVIARPAYQKALATEQVEYKAAA